MFNFYKIQGKIFAIVIAVTLSLCNLFQPVATYAGELSVDEVLTEYLADDEPDQPIVTDDSNLEEESAIDTSETDSEKEYFSELISSEEELLETEDFSSEEDSTDLTDETETEETTCEETTETGEYKELDRIIEELNEASPVLDGMVDDGHETCDREIEDEAGLEDGSSYALMNIQGAYYTESAATILNKLNAIRYEACKNGYKNPSTGKKLTIGDYKPLKWSADLEEIARQRAAEAAIKTAHERPNGKSCFTVKSSRGEQSWGENLAWNWDGLLEGINQWYLEKNDYVRGSSAETGHYKSIINPNFTYVAVACYRTSSNKEWYSVAQEFSNRSDLSETKNSFAGSKAMNIEIAPSAITSVNISGIPKYVEQGKMGKIEAIATASFFYYYSGNKARTGQLVGAPWVVDNSACLSVDGNGNWRTAAVGSQNVGYVNVSMSYAGRTVSAKTYVYDPAHPPLVITSPKKTVYLKGEKIEFAGGSVKNNITNAVRALSANNTTGFDSNTAGIKTLVVSVDGMTKSFNMLVVDKPSLSVQYGKTYGEIVLPSNAYGKFIIDSGVNLSARLSEVGDKVLSCSFVPGSQYKNILSTRTGIKLDLRVYRPIGSDAKITLTESIASYNGVALKPGVKVSFGTTVLRENIDYSVSYTNNVNVGTGRVDISGIGHYTGKISKTFQIKPAELVIKADNKNLIINSRLPAASYYTYTVVGLRGNDKLQTPPKMTCNITSTAKPGKYDITPTGAYVNANYSIKYEKGTLTVASENASYEVKLVTNGHGTVNNPSDYVAVISGALINKPNVTAVSGYMLEGWYRDAEFTREWNFDKDIVKEDMTLYASFVVKGNNNLLIRSIDTYTYTGAAIKPAVSVYDGDKLLKKGADYTIAYYNNIQCNKNGKKTLGTGIGSNFDSTLPYFTITGRGNYSGSLSQNFDIIPYDLGNGTQAKANTTVKVNEQLIANPKKAQKALVSVKSIKAMTEGKDYSVTLMADGACDNLGNLVTTGRVMQNALVPAGYSGCFKLTVTGIGNYSGVITKNITVIDSTALITGATVTLGKNLKNRVYNGKEQLLTPGYYNATKKTYHRAANGSIYSDKVSPDDIFVVKSGNNYLIEGTDYRTEYENNTAVGTASLTIIGMGHYQGRKTVNFKIAGRSFGANDVTVSGMRDVFYTGRAITQNDVTLYWKKGTSEEKRLVYGTDYKITYSGNVNKGRAAMTFVGMNEGGYNGKFTKYFKINPSNIANTSLVAQGSSMRNMTVSYDKAGAKPLDKIDLRLTNGIKLTNGTDYSVTFKNNKACTVGVQGVKNIPQMIITGKGNYSGTIVVPFAIAKKSLKDSSIQINVSPCTYKPAAKDAYRYVPAVTVRDGAATLGTGEYEIKCFNNSQAEIKTYMAAIAAGKSPSVTPYVQVSAKNTGNYTSDNSLVYTIPIYSEKLSSANTVILVSDCRYTGSQLRPGVNVYYSSNSSVVSRAKKCKTEKDILATGMVKLATSKYTVSYGNNIIAGTNRGSVTVTGKAPYFGGSVTGKFTIVTKGIY